MRTSKTFTVLLTLLCAWIAFVVVAVPVTLVYLWLHPADFWQKLAFGLALIVAALFPFKRTRKTSKPNTSTMKNELEACDFPITAASLGLDKESFKARLREMTDEEAIAFNRLIRGEDRLIDARHS